MNRTRAKKIIAKKRKRPSKKLKEFFKNKNKTQAELARLLELNRATIWQWINRTGVPSRYVDVIVEFTDYEVSQQDIRPDIYNQ